MKGIQKRHWLLCPVSLLVLYSITWAGSAPINEDNEKAIIAKVTKESVIVLASGSGKLTPGENELCIVVRDPLTGSAAAVRSVSIGFAQHVGRILESPISAQLTHESVGRYCGQVNLGRAYYEPMSFHAEVRYMDAGNRKQKVGFCLTAE
jgi:hypothetical protein